MKPYVSKIEYIAPKRKLKFKNPLYSIDATAIDLCLSLYDWAKFRTTKGAVKLHVKLKSTADYIPTFAIVTTEKVHEQKHIVLLTNNFHASSHSPPKILQPQLDLF